MSKESVKTLKPHISLNVRNVDESVAFYKKLFGIDPIKHIKGNTRTHSILNERSGEPSENSRFGYAKFDLHNPQLNFVLNEVEYTKGGTLSHLGIQVASTDDVLKTRERWIAGGLITADEMQVDCCYALQDKTWARDPDGNEWEVFVVHANTEPQAASCAGGNKLAEPENSAEVCCTDKQKAPTIAASNQACC